MTTIATSTAEKQRGKPSLLVCKLCGKQFVRLGSRGGAAIYGCPDHNNVEHLEEVE